MLKELWNRVFFAPDNGIPDLGGFSVEEPEEPEIIELGPGEEPPEEDEETPADPDVITLSRADYERLQQPQGGDTTKALLEGLKGIQESLKPGTPELTQGARESDEDFASRLSKELFDENLAPKVLEEAINRYTGGERAQLRAMVSQQNKKLLALDAETGPIFKRYQGEIEEFVKKLPPEQQIHPNVWQFAMDQVKVKHVGELQQETIADTVQKRVAEALAAYGIDPSTPPAPTSKQRQQAAGFGASGGRGSAHATTKSVGKQKKVYVTAEDRRIAAERMLPLNQYLRMIGKLK